MPPPPLHEACAGAWEGLTQLPAPLLPVTCFCGEGYLCPLCLQGVPARSPAWGLYPEAVRTLGDNRQMLGGGVAVGGAVRGGWRAALILGKGSTAHWPRGPLAGGWGMGGQDWEVRPTWGVLGQGWG